MAELLKGMGRPGGESQKGRWCKGDDKAGERVIQVGRLFMLAIGARESGKAAGKVVGLVRGDKAGKVRRGVEQWAWLGAENMAWKRGCQGMGVKMDMHASGRQVCMHGSGLRRPCKWEGMGFYLFFVFF